ALSNAKGTQVNRQGKLRGFHCQETLTALNTLRLNGLVTVYVGTNVPKTLSHTQRHTHTLAYFCLSLCLSIFLSDVVLPPYFCQSSLANTHPGLRSVSTQSLLISLS